MKKTLIIAVFSLLFLCGYSKTSNPSPGIYLFAEKPVMAVTPLAATHEDVTTAVVQPEKETRPSGDICIIVFKQCDPKH